jgi:hypothetical protein
MDMQAVISKARSAAAQAAESYRQPGQHEDFVIATVRYGSGQTERFSGPERFAEAKALTFADFLKQHGIQASWTSHVD